MEYYVQRINFDHWVNICGPFGSENEAYIYAKGCVGNISYGKSIRIVTDTGSVVNFL